jgi:hypothetical protein
MCPTKGAGRPKNKEDTNMRGTIRCSGCVSKATYHALQARRRKDTAEYIIHDGKRYEYRSDTQIFRHDATRLTRVKKAEWLAIKAQHGEVE